MTYFIKLIISFLILFFTDNYFYKGLNFLGISVGGISLTVIELVIYLIIAGLIYLLYHSEVNAAYHKYNHKLFSNLLYTFISFIVLFISIMVFSYIARFLARSLNVNFVEPSFYNIFKQRFSLELCLYILKNMIIKPFIYVSVFVLGVCNLFSGKSAVFFSGLLYSLYTFYPFNHSFEYMIVNIIIPFATFGVLSFIYKKENNYYYSLYTYILYLVFGGMLVIKFL